MFNRSVSKRGISERARFRKRNSRCSEQSRSFVFGNGGD